MFKDIYIQHSNMSLDLKSSEPHVETASPCTTDGDLTSSFPPALQIQLSAETLLCREKWSKTI